MQPTPAPPPPTAGIGEVGKAASRRQCHAADARSAAPDGWHRGSGEGGFAPPVSHALHAAFGRSAFATDWRG